MPREGRVLDQRAQRRILPARLRLAAPLLDHLGDLGGVEHAGDIELGHAVICAQLGQGAEDRARGEHRRGDADAAPGLAEAARDPVRERLAVPGREPGPNAVAVDIDRRRVDVAGARDVALLPQLLEVLAGSGRRAACE